MLFLRIYLVFRLTPFEGTQERVSVDLKYIRIYQLNLANLILENDVLCQISKDVEICHRLLEQMFNPRSRSLSNYRSGTVNSKSFVGKVLLRIKWKFELINAL